MKSSTSENREERNRELDSFDISPAKYVFVIA